VGRIGGGLDRDPPLRLSRASGPAGWGKRRLRHWTIASSADDVAIVAAKELANLDVEALVPVGGRFPDPGLAHLVASLIPIWKRATGRTPGPISADKEGGKKRKEEMSVR
jgi:hypothetical protein